MVGLLSFLVEFVKGYYLIARLGIAVALGLMDFVAKHLWITRMLSTGPQAPMPS